MIEWFEALSVAARGLRLCCRSVHTRSGHPDGDDVFRLRRRDGDADLPDLDGDGVPDGISAAMRPAKPTILKLPSVERTAYVLAARDCGLLLHFRLAGPDDGHQRQEEWLAVLIAFIGGFLAMLGVAFLLKVLSSCKATARWTSATPSAPAEACTSASAAAQREGEGEPAHTGASWRNWTPSPMRKRRCPSGPRSS